MEHSLFVKLVNLLNKIYCTLRVILINARYDKVEKVLLKQNNKIRAYTTGTLCLTPAYLIFIEPTGVKETWVCFVTMITVLLP